jgi:hypothetical protein
MGARLLRSWILKPLLNPVEIMARQGAVSDFLSSRRISDEMSELLSGMLDPRALLSASLKFNLVRGDDGTVSVLAPEVTPIFCHYDTDYNEFSLYKLADYSQQLVSRHGAQFQIPFSYNDLCRFVRLSVKGDLLPEQFKK